MSASSDKALQEHEELFLLAAEHGEMKTLRQLLREHGDALLTVRGRAGDTALHLAAKSGELTAVSALVSRGAPVDVEGFSGSTALHDAAYEGHFDIVGQLVEAGADINAVCPSGTPLISSMYEANHDVTRLLLDKGALIERAGDDPARPNALVCEDGHNALGWIRRNNDVVAFREFVARGLIPVEPSSTMLDWVLAEGDVDVSSLVIACLDDPALSGEVTHDRIQAYARENKNKQVAAVLRAEELRFDLEAAIGAPAAGEPERRATQAGMGL
jgi:ankyrin repeat protein